MIEIKIISILLSLPILGVLGVLLFKKSSYIIGVLTSFVTFFISLILLFKFDILNSTNYQFMENFVLIESLKIHYRVGVDGVSLPLILLTTFLTPICIIASKKSINKYFGGFVIAFLLLESLVIGVFCALDISLFYLFFEAMLIPMYMIIGIWGGENRIYASYKFFLYTLAGSVFLLIAIIFMYNYHNTMNIIELTDLIAKDDFKIQYWLFLALFASFAVKIPMWPFHTWLPDAHVQAPTAGSVILAGILLKMGAYGFIRFSLPMLPEASKYFANFIFILSSIAVVYASLLAIAQEDMKKLIAYSSIAHMGYVTIGIFSFNLQGIEGAMFQMISHGLVSSALFLCVGNLYERTHTKAIKDYGGVAGVMPKFAVMMLFFSMASIGLPGTSGFVGEIMVLSGAYMVTKLGCIIAGFGLILGAVYMLYLYKRVCFGEVKNQIILDLKDLNFRELSISCSIFIIVLILGIYPKLLTDIFNLNALSIAKNITLGK